MGLWCQLRKGKIRLYKVSYKNNERHAHFIPRDQWGSLGFYENMTAEEARARVKQLNAQDELARYEHLRQAAKIEKIIESAFLPPNLVSEFIQRKKPNPSTWLAAQRAIAAVALPPEDWEDEPEAFYRYWVARKVSPSYMKKILFLLNRWGKFYAKKFQKPFLPLPHPRGANLQRITDAYETRIPGGRQSDPLTPTMLANARPKLKEEHYKWLFISVWLGLRPEEVEWLHQGQWRVETQEGHKCLFVYQSKLVALVKEDRWKIIPLLFQEQHEALKMIMGKVFTKPSRKVLNRHFPPRVRPYAGRKGFYDLMTQEKGQSPYATQSWLGHHKFRIEYVNKRKVKLK